MAIATSTFSVATNLRLELSANIVGEDSTGFSIQYELGIRKLSGSAGSASISLAVGTMWTTTGAGAGSDSTFGYDLTTSSYAALWTRLVRADESVMAVDGRTIQFSAQSPARLSNAIGTTPLISVSVTMPAASKATAPSFTPTTFDAGTAIAIALPRQVSTYTHDLYYSFGSLNNVLITTGAATSYSYTPPTSLTSEIPTANEGAYTITAVTKTATGVEVGRRSFTGTLRVPGSQNPTVTAFAASDTNATVAAQVGAYVQSLSTIRLDSVTATASGGATIAERRLGIEGQDLRILDTRALLQSGTVPVVARAWDSRGLVGSLNGSISVLAYSQPVVAVALPAAPSGSVFRSNGSGVYDANGQNISYRLVGSVASLVNGTQRNSFTVRISTRPFDSTTWTVRNTVTPTTTTSGGRINAAAQTIVVGGGAIYLADSSYVVRVEVYDKFNSVIQDTTISTSYVTIDLDGQSVGVAKLRERGSLDVGGAGYFRGLYTSYETVNDVNTPSFAGSYYVSASATNRPAGLAAGPAMLRIERFIASTGVDGVIQSISPPSDPLRILYSRTALTPTNTDVASWSAWSVNGQSSVFSGTDAERLALPAVLLFNGLRYRTTDVGLDWVLTSGAWRIAPGQRLAGMSGSTTSGVAGDILGSVATTPTLPVGQRVRVVCSRVAMYNAPAGGVVYAMNFRNNASPVTSATFDRSVAGRAYQPGSNSVVSVPGSSFEYVTTVAAPVSAGLYVASGIAHGPDGQELWIESC